MPYEHFVNTVTDIVYPQFLRDKHRASYRKAWRQSHYDVKHPYMYHGSSYDHPVGSELKPRTLYDPKHGKDTALMFGTKRRTQAYGYATAPRGTDKAKEAFKRSQEGKIPVSRKAGWIYTLKHSEHWVDPEAGFKARNPDIRHTVEASEYFTEHPHKIIARERVKIPRHKVPVTRNELIGGAAGVAVIGGAAAGAYYYRHHNGKLQRVHKGRQPSKHMHRSMMP